VPKKNLDLAKAMGQRMLQRRKELGLTQEAVAELAGITHQQYNRAEKGKTCIGSDTLVCLSGALQISADFLLTGATRSDRLQASLNILETMTDSQIAITNSILTDLLKLGETIPR